MPLRQEKHEPCRAVRRFHLVGTGATSGQAAFSGGSGGGGASSDWNNLGEIGRAHV